ncbi:MAG: glycosyltransferase family 4 protein, partial [Chloroflexota bacterium]|nr:glycosyltransferase family 4 protein [Chloroflexota bacterium]
VTLPYVDRAYWRRIPLLGRQYTLTKLLERLSFGLAGLPWLLWHRPAVVYIQKPYDLPVAALCRLVGIHTVFGCHGKDFWLGDRLFTRAMQASVSCSAYNATQVHARYGLRPTVIYNGVDTALFRPVGRGPWAVGRESDVSEQAAANHGRDSERRTQNAELNSTAHGPRPTAHVVLFAGRLVRWKGVEYLIEALPLLQTPNVAVWIAGEGPYQPELQALAARLGVSERVQFLGQVPTADLPALYAQAAVVVGTSFVNETFGIALAEAMACGRPVVASRFGGFPEVVAEGETGLLARPQDPADLAAQLDAVLGDSARAAALGAAGLARVQRLFTWEAVVDRLTVVLRTLGD